MTRPTESAWQSFCSAFAELRRLPAALWCFIGVFVVSSSAYFGVLTLMTTYLHDDLGWSDQRAGLAVSFFTMLITLLMLGAGSYAESFGLKRAVIAALCFSVVGRLIYTWMPGAFPALSVAVIVVAILVTATGEAIVQPVCYSGVKQYTNERTSAMGYGLIYALMNLGIVVIAAVSSWVRPAVQSIKDHQAAPAEANSFIAWLASFSKSGVEAVNWLCVALTAAALVAFALVVTKRVEASKLRPDTQDQAAGDPAIPWTRRVWVYFSEGPFSNPRFLLFIFMLLPVRTLFAHQWLTMPTYILRAYHGQTVAHYTPWIESLGHSLEHGWPALAAPFLWLAAKPVPDLMEWLVNWINPGIIFIGVPVLTALTRHVHVYTMMIIGSLVSAVPTFLLCGGPDLNLLVTYFVIFSIGEALWSARFLEYASELAPPGRIAQYMGLAQVPWLLAKGTTGLYSGWMLATFCPDKAPTESLHTGKLWFIYGCVAMASPIGLWLARRWVRAGLATGKPPVARA